MPIIKSGSSSTIKLKALATITLSNGAGVASVAFEEATPTNHTGTKTYGPFPTPGKFTIAATTGDVSYSVGTLRNKASNEQQVLGPVHTLTNLSTAFPAANNIGKEALIGPTAPYARYISNGVDWEKVTSVSTNQEPVLYQSGQLVTPGGDVVGGPSSSGIPGSAYGLKPDSSDDQTARLQSALTAARIAGKPVILLPGKYIYTSKIDNAGGGLVCPDGEAWLDNQDPAYASVVIDFQSTDSSYLDGITVQGIKFTCSTRPDVGMTNGAIETNHFIRVTKAKNVKIWGNKFSHNQGGCVLFRDVEDSSIIGNEADDVWKDAFHVTDSSRNIIRAHNIVKGGGDDAFPVVGYVTKGTYPVGIQDIGNRVYGVRKARAFAYVGCRDVINIGCFVDGRTPSYIPQQSDAGGGRYNTSCAIYIAAESAFNSYGNENIRVQGFVGQYLASGIDGAGSATSTLQAIHIVASNGASYPIKNIQIQATLRGLGNRGLFCVGNGNVQDVEADITVEDNTDPLGLLSLTSTPGAGNQNAAEFQNTRNVKLKLRANKIGKGAVFIDANCSGTYDLDVSVGALSQTTGAQSPVQIASASKIDLIDFKLNFETTPAASGLGSINRIIDNGTNQGIVRSTRVTGVNHATAAANVLSGWPTRAVTLGASPSQVLNYAGRQLLFYSRLGTVSSISRAGVRGRVVAKAVTTGASGTVQCDGDWTDIYTAAAVVTLFNGRGVKIATGIVASSAVSGGVTTVTFDATGVNASFAVGMQMAVVSTPKVIDGRTNGVIDLPPETVVEVTYSAAPTCAVTEQSY